VGRHAQLPAANGDPACTSSACCYMRPDLYTAIIPSNQKIADIRPKSKALIACGYWLHMSQCSSDARTHPHLSVWHRSRCIALLLLVSAAPTKHLLASTDQCNQQQTATPPPDLHLHLVLPIKTLQTTHKQSPSRVTTTSAASLLLHQTPGATCGCPAGCEQRGGSARWLDRSSCSGTWRVFGDGRGACMEGEGRCGLLEGLARGWRQRLKGCGEHAE